MPDNAGTMGTQKGFTGQYADSLSGLDYYNARYYDPVVGRFISADVKQDNLHGFDPYAYVLGNPETKNDPTGEFWFDPGTGQGVWLRPGLPPVIFQYTPPVAVLQKPVPNMPSVKSPSVKNGQSDSGKIVSTAAAALPAGLRNLAVRLMQNNSRLKG